MPRVESNYGGGYIIYGRGRGKDGELIQTDWDFPRAAEDLGWSLARVQRRGNYTIHFSRRVRPRCDHRGTDGTINCPDCGVTASDFIRAAAEFLDSKC